MTSVSQKYCLFVECVRCFAPMRVFHVSVYMDVIEVVIDFSGGER